MNQLAIVQRHELKFFINRGDYEYCRSILRHLMRRDEHQKEDQGYFIRSLYFDDTVDSSVQEKLDGVEYRDKYRLRIYDHRQPWAKLERKRKVNQYVNKTSVLVTREEALEMTEGNYDFLLNKSEPAAKSIYFDLKRKYFRPKVVVDYWRDVYKLDYNEIRITFDWGLKTSMDDLNLFDPNLITHPLQNKNIIVMEVKFNTCLPAWFRDFLAFEGPVNSAISKYCYGRMDTREYY